MTGNEHLRWPQWLPWTRKDVTQPQQDGTWDEFAQTGRDAGAADATIMSIPADEARDILSAMAAQHLDDFWQLHAKYYPQPGQDIQTST